MVKNILTDFIRQLYKLHKTTSNLIPINKISKYQNEQYSTILSCINKLIDTSKKEKEKINNSCKSLELLINQKCTNLNLNKPELPKFINLKLKNNFLNNELDKLNIIEKTLECEIDLWIEKIEILYDEIYQEKFVCKNKQISQEFFINLKNLHKQLKEEKSKKEKKRKEMYKTIKLLIKRLELDEKLSYFDNIKSLEDKFHLYTKISQEREEEIFKYKNLILCKEELLKLPNTIFTTSLSENYLFFLRKRLSFLDDEYNRKIDEIYISHKNILKDLFLLFSMNEEIFEKSDIGLVKMKNKIKDLEEKKDSFLEISNLIERRYSLLENMNEFEKIASDPKRLFKSSFQLNREEKFRKNAFPSLLKIEEEILNKLEEYSKKYGIYKKDEKVYKEIIKKEIEGRIINKTVFINKFDSPYKRKKNDL